MIRRTVAAIARPSISFLAILTGITGTVAGVEFGPGVGLLIASILGVLSIAITSEP